MLSELLPSTASVFINAQLYSSREFTFVMCVCDFTKNLIFCKRLRKKYNVDNAMYITYTICDFDVNA